MSIAMEVMMSFVGSMIATVTVLLAADRLDRVSQKNQAQNQASPKPDEMASLINSPPILVTFQQQGLRHCL